MIPHVAPPASWDILFRREDGDGWPDVTTSAATTYRVTAISVTVTASREDGSLDAGRPQIREARQVLPGGRLGRRTPRGPLRYDPLVSGEIAVTELFRQLRAAAAGLVWDQLAAVRRALEFAAAGCAEPVSDLAGDPAPYLAVLAAWYPGEYPSAPGPDTPGRLSKGDPAT